MNLSAEKKVSDIMSFDAIVMEADESIREAAILMKNNDIGFLPIISKGSIVGVVTDRDLVIRGYAEGKKDTTKISEIMTSGCIAVEHNASIEKAAKLMAENKIRRLCVVEGEKLVGVCAIGDIATSRNTMSEAKDALEQISKPEKRNIFV